MYSCDSQSDDSKPISITQVIKLLCENINNISEPITGINFPIVRTRDFVFQLAHMLNEEFLGEFVIAGENSINVVLQTGEKFKLSIEKDDDDVRKYLA